MTKPVLLLLDTPDDGIPDLDKQLAQFEVLSYTCTSRQQFEHDLHHSLAHVSGIMAFWSGLMACGSIDADLVAHFPSSLRAIAVCSVGYNQFDIDALTARGIKLFNAPAISAQTCAEMAVQLTYSVFRFTSAFEHALRELGGSVAARCAVADLDLATGQMDLDKYRKGPDRYEFGFCVSKDPNKFAESPSGHVVGIVGFGAIGKRTGQLLAASRMEVHYCKRSPLSAEDEARLGYKAYYHSSVQDMAPLCDVLVLALPGSPETNHLINGPLIASMKRGSRIVNISRGSHVDETAVLAALKLGQLAGFGADVFADEQAVSLELRRRWDVTMTPHIAASTVKSAVECQALSLRNLVDALVRGDVSNALN